MASFLSSTFEPFPRLPPELRREIWRYASTIPGPKPGVCVLPRDAGDPHSSRMVLESGNAAMLLTSREARHIGLECLVTRAYDPATDILYIPLADLFMFFCQLCGNGHPRWIPDICHVAMPFPPEMECRCLSWALMHLRSLQSVSIVFPNTYDGRGARPPWRWACLRLLEDTELDDSGSRTGHDSRSTHSESDEQPEDSSQQIQSYASTRDQLDTFAAELNRHVWEGSDKTAITSWDDELKGLRLRFEARCFATSR